MSSAERTQIDAAKARLRHQFETLSRSVYVGREHLGRYKQIGETQFRAFSSAGRSLGVFRSASAALAAIDAAHMACRTR